MNQFFRCFCINRFGLGPLHYLLSHSDFGFKFSEIFVFENRLPALVSRGVDMIAWSIHFLKTFEFYCDSTLHPWLIFCQIGPLKVPKREIFLTELSILSVPI
jgi:hypothetical protein